jgi:hypothetical protein
MEDDSRTMQQFFNCNNGERISCGSLAQSIIVIMVRRSLDRATFIG